MEQIEKIKQIFRPGLIIFVGAVGNAIYEQFFQGLDPVIPALIEYMEKSLTSQIYLVRPGEKSTTYQHHMANSTEAPGNQDLKSAISYMYNKFIDDMIIRDDQVSGQRANLPLVYVIGHVSDPEIREAVDIAHEKEPSWSIRCLCSCDPLEQLQDESGRDELTSNWNIIPDDLVEWGQKMQIELCYLFGNVKREDLEKDRATNNYALAQALFAMLHTGILSQRTQEKLPQFSLGTLSTCLIIVPREAILYAYRAQIAAHMVIDWLAKSVDLRADNNSDEEVRRLVKNDIYVITQQIEKQKASSHMPIQKKSARPLRLSALAHWPPSQKWLNKVEADYKARRNNWPEEKQDTVGTWSKMYKDAREQVSKTIQNLVDEKKGVAWIIAYADILDEKLERLQQAVSVQEGNEDAHKGDLNNEDHPSPYSTLLKAIKQQPNRTTLLMMAALSSTFALVIALFLLNIFSSIVGIPGWLQWFIPIFLPLIGILTLNWFYIKGLYLPGIQAKRDLLEYYHSTFVSYRENEEQTQYASLLRALSSCIKGIRSSSLKDFCKHSEEDARQVFTRLFKSAAASRRIFVSKNRYFSQEAEFAMSAFFELKKREQSQPQPGLKEMFDQLTDKPSFSDGMTAAYLEEVADEKNGAQQRIDTVSNPTIDFYVRVKNLMESPTITKALKNLFSVDAKSLVNDITLKDSRMWNEVFKRLNSKIWQQQEEISETQNLYLYGSNDILAGIDPAVKNKYKGHIIKIYTSLAVQPEAEAVRQADARPFDWLLIAVPYHGKTESLAQPTQ